MTDRELRKILYGLPYEVYKAHQNGQTLESFALKQKFTLPFIQIQYNMAVKNIREYQGHRNMQKKEHAEFPFTLGELACIADVLEESLPDAVAYRELHADMQGYWDYRIEKTKQLLERLKRHLDGMGITKTDEQTVKIE